MRAEHLGAAVTPTVPEGAVGGSEPQQLSHRATIPHTHHARSCTVHPLCTPQIRRTGSLLVTDLRCERGPGLLTSRTPAFEKKLSSCSSTWTDFLSTEITTLALSWMTNKCLMGMAQLLLESPEMGTCLDPGGKEADSDHVVLTFLRQREKNTSNRGFSSGTKALHMITQQIETCLLLHGGCQTLVTGCL